MLYRDREIQIIKDNLEKNYRQISRILAKHGFQRSEFGIKAKIPRLGLISQRAASKKRSMPFSQRVTRFVPMGVFISKVEADFQRYKTPYIIAEQEGLYALYRQPICRSRGKEPPVETWVTHYGQPTNQT